jgi:hypothetical protein
MQTFFDALQAFIYKAHRAVFFSRMILLLNTNKKGQ